MSWFRFRPFRAIHARFDVLDAHNTLSLKWRIKMSQLVQDLAAAVAAVGPAINALEAKVTEALKNSGISPEDKAAIEQAIADLKAAVADAADGVDEAVPPVDPAPVSDIPIL